MQVTAWPSQALLTAEPRGRAISPVPASGRWRQIAKPAASSPAAKSLPARRAAELSACSCYGFPQGRAKTVAITASSSWVPGHSSADLPGLGVSPLPFPPQIVSSTT